MSGAESKQAAATNEGRGAIADCALDVVEHAWRESGEDLMAMYENSLSLSSADFGSGANYIESTIPVSSPNTAPH